MALSKPGHIRLNKTPFFEYNLVESGTWKFPTLTHMTHGSRDNSRIFHTKEDGNYYEYRVRYGMIGNLGKVKKTGTNLNETII